MGVTAMRLTQIISMEHNYLLNRNMLVALFPDAEIVTEWFLGLPKSFTAIRAASTHNATSIAH